ncbi:MAG: beta-propeller domain-containing protein [Dehalococcoidia bacterium]|nr:beta-propeller domain-containing protein [Dehalococcoidia bacterium]
MKHEDFIEKLEHLKTPEIELPGHKQALKMALLNSGHFRERAIMNWAKILAPITAALLLIAVVGVFVNNPGPVHLGGNQISRFASYWELQEFVETNAEYGQFYWGLEGKEVILAPGSAEGWDSALAVNEFSVRGDIAADYSATNIQVAGVDEADIVKTDGQYIYVASGNKTIIVKAYPPEQAQALSEIELEGRVIGIFIKGDRLVVFEEETPYYPYYGDVRWATGEKFAYQSPKTYIKVYDVSDRANPRLQRELSTDGQYVSSRMIGDYAYVVVNEPVYEQNDEINLPRIYSGGDEKGTKIPATDIYYSDVADYYYMYTTIMAINTQNDGQEPTYETILLGASSNLYVSTDNIYLTFPVWGGDVGDSEKTSIHRIHIQGGAMNYTTSGEVPGTVLNQFSMDEYEGYFRVATTSYGQTTENNVYILNMALNITGSVEDLAPGERIYSARFMGERCYLVTFKQVDPLFVIDLKDPYDPEVLGYLKVTGYSDYLHAYDENHIIGIGKETTDAGTFAWYQGVKISLFDVTDVSNPREISKLEIGDRGSDSPVLWDHKAFLFDKSRNLLVMPILVAEVDQSEYPEGVPSWAYGEPVWQGAYAFNVSIDDGLQLRGKITHVENITDPEQGYYYFYSPFAVERSLYIDNVLYTISDAKIMMNSLDNLDYINEVKLPYSTWTPYEYLPGETRSEEPSAGAQSGGEELQK